MRHTHHTLSSRIVLRISLVDLSKYLRSLAPLNQLLTLPKPKSDERDLNSKSPSRGLTAGGAACVGNLGDLIIRVIETCQPPKKSLRRPCEADTMSTTLELFWNLSSSKKKERLDATAKLVVTLHKFQSEFTPPEVSDGEGMSDSAQADTLGTLNAQDVSYSIRRLIRGLASPRESSRLGFAVALTEVRPICQALIVFTDSWCAKLLSRLDTVTCGQIMTLVLDASKPQGSVSGQEERDNLFAQLFGITSIIQSGLIARNGTVPTSSTSASSLESYELIVTTLVALGEKKSWLRESAWWALVSAIEALAKSDVEWKEQGVEATIETIFAKGSGWTPEKLALALRLQAQFPEKDWSRALSPVFKNADILATQNLKVVTKILKVRLCILQNHMAASFFYRSLEPQRKTPSRAQPQQCGNLSCTSSGPSSWTSCYLRAKMPLLRVPSKTFGVSSLMVSLRPRGNCPSISPTRPRIPLFVDVISGAKVLGISIIPKGTTQNSKLPRSTFPLHQKFHALLDKPSLKKRPLLA
jgi:hypothetical protein